MKIAHYVLASWRHILKNKLFSAINILGLAVGLAAVILISLFVRDELSYDTFWSKADNIYRTETTLKSPNRDDMNFVVTPGPVMHALKKDFPQIEYAARVKKQEPTLIQNGNIFVEEIALVDPDIIYIFDFNVLKGDLKAALDINTGLALNETMAEKYFADREPIGKILTLDFDEYKRDYVVTAIFEDLPKNSQFELSSMALAVEDDWVDQTWIYQQWFSLGAQLYYTTFPGTDIGEIQDQMPDFIDRNVPNQSNDPNRKVSDFYLLNSLNVKDLHLKAFGMGEYRVRGSINTVIIFSAIAVLILVIAIINFVNLSTAKASQRAKEVSLRKVLGASRKNLIVQFLGESISLTVIGFLISLVIVEISLPLYNDILSKELSINYSPSEIILFIIFVVTVGFISAFYPAMVLSNYRPAEILKANKSTESRASIKLRAVLVIIQFTVSISLFVSTAVVYGQMQYAKNIDLGYNEQNLLVLRGIGRESISKKRELLVNEFKRMPEVSGVSWSNFVPGHMNENNTNIRTSEMTREASMLVGQRRVGYDFFKTFETELIVGREYELSRNDEQVSYDDVRAGKGHRASLIINRSALRNLNLGSADEALGKTLYIAAGDDIDAEFEVVGVIPDLHLESLKKTTRSEIYQLRTTFATAIYIRYSGDPLQLLEKVRTLWQREAGGIPFEYEFLTDAISGQYQSEQGQATMFAAFSGLAILIACMGLYGLASFTAERRTKEIGIRKVMGANITSIIKLMLWQFSKPVIIANLIAWPISFYAMTLWLESFVYRIESSLIFGFCISAGFAALIIAWITVASNSYRIASTNPIYALRYE